MRKPGIPPPHDPRHCMQAMKENIELITGVRGDPLTSLSTAATTAEIIEKINAIIERINA